MTTPYISCIIPVFNGEYHIGKLLDALITQDVMNIEIIVVDDGSTDNTLSILSNYKKDNRVKIISSKENLGCSEARNIGLEKALGEYIHFIDSDDLILKNIYSTLSNTIIQYSPDIIIFDYYKSYHNGKIDKAKQRSLIPNKIYNSTADKITTLKAGVPVWNKLYKRDFLLQNNLRFIPNIFYEDVPFFWCSIIAANKIVYVNELLHHYNQRKNSIMHSVVNSKKMSDMLFGFFYIKEYLEKTNNYNNFETLFSQRFLKSLLSFYSKLKENKEDFFFRISDSISFIKPNIIRKLGLRKYYAFYLLRNKYYILYRIFFKWI